MGPVGPTQTFWGPGLKTLHSLPVLPDSPNNPFELFCGKSMQSCMHQSRIFNHSQTWCRPSLLQNCVSWIAQIHKFVVSHAYVTDDGIMVLTCCSVVIFETLYNFYIKISSICRNWSFSELPSLLMMILCFEIEQHVFLFVFVSQVTAARYACEILDTKLITGLSITQSCE